MYSKMLHEGIIKRVASVWRHDAVHDVISNPCERHNIPTYSKINFPDKINESFSFLAIHLSRFKQKITEIKKSSIFSHWWRHKCTYINILHHKGLWSDFFWQIEGTFISVDSTFMHPNMTGCGDIGGYIFLYRDLDWWPWKMTLTLTFSVAPRPEFFVIIIGRSMPNLALLFG